MTKVIAYAEIDSVETKLEKMNVMKYLLGLENKDIEVNEETLSEKLNLILNRNFAALIPLNEYFRLTPKEMEADFSKIIAAVEKPAIYTELYKKFKEDLKKNPRYNKFSKYIRMASMGSAITKEDIVKNKSNFKNIIKIIDESDRLYNIFLFNIVSELCNNIIKFECTRNIILNFPLLFYWSKLNKYKPIENLSDDDCIIIASLLAGHDNDIILNFLDLPNSNINSNYINSIMKNLPVKFNVKNLSQVIFRVLLLNPKIWVPTTDNNLLYDIKHINRLIRS